MPKSDVRLLHPGVAGDDASLQVECLLDEPCTPACKVAMVVFQLAKVEQYLEELLGAEQMPDGLEEIYDLVQEISVLLQEVHGEMVGGSQ
ncbi:MAG: hypothetical protein AAFU71_14305 [Cyanobacteria bacterium J06632_22]